MNDARFECPSCSGRVAADDVFCKHCGRGIATLIVRSRFDGEVVTIRQRVGCDAEAVAALDGLEVDISGSGSVLGRRD